MFGAYFGLAVSYQFPSPPKEPDQGTVPDLLSLLGTLCLWIYWPSFVAGAAVADSQQQERAFVNTILALSSSTVLAFISSSYLNSRNNNHFRPADIQNATLAGGVAIGCTANLTMNSLCAVLIGSTAGIVSTIGYNFIQPYLEHHHHIHDTCGVHNLHAMPSLVGALASVVLAAYNSSNGMSHDADIYGGTYEGQWWRQLAAIPVCITFAIVAGSLLGSFLRP
jgi:ammonium transporter Rh